MNTEMIERRWNRLLDAMSEAARDLAVPLLGMPIGVAVGMITRPEMYSPLEMRVTAIIYLALVVTMMAIATVKYWRHPKPTPNPERAQQQLALAQETLANATALYEGAVAIHETTTKLLRAARDQPEPTDQP